MLTIKQFIFNHFGENTYIVCDTESLDAVVVDPGMFSGSEKVAFDNFVAEKRLRLRRIILTHGHLDHCFGVGHIVERYNIPVTGHRDDEALTQSLPQQAERFGMTRTVSAGFALDDSIDDGGRIVIGNSHLDVLHVPGHSPGGLALYAPTEKFVIVGDSLFRGSIGRTDLPGGDYATLVRAVQKKLLSLPDDTVVLPGHGDFTTVATEKASNPYV